MDRTQTKFVCDQRHVSGAENVTQRAYNCLIKELRSELVIMTSDYPTILLSKCCNINVVFVIVVI